MVKKILIGLAILVVLIVAAGVIIPIAFKDDIKAAIDKEIQASVNADVLFDVDNFSLTVFQNFPNVTAQIKELGVFNHAPFEGVPLFVVQELDVEVNIMDVLFGDQLRLKGLRLVQPLINVAVLADGRANYDITFPSTDTVTVSEEPGAFSFGIDHWEIVDGEIVYDDKSIPFYLSLKGVNHTGSGDFNEQSFDMSTFSVADSLTVAYDGMEYLTNKRLEADMILGISEDYTRFTFKENSARMNDFAMHFDGWFKMSGADYEMDIAFDTPENTFKSLLSLVPGMYTQDFGSLQTEGDLAFSGFVKGIYNETQMPAFNLNLTVNDAMFKYPDLPTPVSNINMELLIDNKDGIIENTLVDLKRLHLDFGSNPVDASLLISNLKNYEMDASIKASLNLAELNQMFPLEGLEMRGRYSVNATAKGIYDSIANIIPAMDVSMALTDGYIKSAEFPIPIENLKFQSTIKNTSGRMAETVIAVNDLSMVMHDEPFTLNMLVQNLDDYTWDLSAKGGVDMEEISRIFPVEGMALAGKVQADFQTKGKMSDLDAGRYDRLPTSGTVSLRNFKYASPDLPYAVTIAQSDAVFDPRKIDLRNTSGTIGKSDFAVSGSVNNYIGYVLHPNEVIKGTISFNSTLLDLNEFMTETDETATASTDTTAYGVIPLPKNIDFVLVSSVKTVKMMEYTLTNASGDIIVRDGIANLNGLKFNMLGGTFVVNGAYNPTNLEHPTYDFALNIQNLSIKQAATSFSMVQTYAPIAGLVNGNFNTDFKVSGELGQDLMPKLNTVNGSGLVKIAQAALTGSKLVSGITSLTKLEDSDNVSLKDVLMSASIDNGRLSVNPFDVTFGSYVTTIAGSSGLDGSIDYSLRMNVPAGKLGTQFNSFVGQYAGANSNPNSMIPVTIALGGLYNDPQTKLVMTEQKQQAKEAVTNLVQEKGQDAVQQITSGAKPQDVVKNLMNTEKSDSAQTSGTTTAPVTVQEVKQEVQEVKEEAKEELQNRLNNLLNRKK